MKVDDAVHQARIDNSGTRMITAMSHIDPNVFAALAEEFAETRLRPNSVAPTLFALPQMIERDHTGHFEGACFIASPHAKVTAA